jgi:hypothetical protein
LNVFNKSMEGMRVLVKGLLNGFKSNPWSEIHLTRGEESRLKAGCSQDWLPHKIVAAREGIAIKSRHTIRLGLFGLL